MGDTAVAAVAAASAEGAERDMDSVVEAATVEAEVEASVLAAVGMEERAEARVGGRWWRGLRIRKYREGSGALRCASARPVPFRKVKFADYPGKDDPTHSPGSRYLQELAPLRTVL